MIVYIIVIYMNYYPAKLYFFCQKEEKKARICILYPCFCSKVTREKVYDTQKTQKDDLAKRKVILFIELSHVVQERARGFCPFRACGAYMRNLSKYIFIDKILFIIS